MTINDLLIIYLACGAPFGVYYYFDKRPVLPANRLWLKTFIIILIWIPFGLNLLIKFKKNLNGFESDFDKNSQLDSELDKNIFLIQKNLERILVKSNPAFSIFEFREVAERYVGLTLAKQNAENITDIENVKSEIFKISKNDNAEISTVCLNRRNRKRLSFHQKNARQDFLHALEGISSSTTDRKNLGFLSFEFVTLLNDIEAQNMLLRMLDDYQQTEEDLIVKNTENELWKTETQKPLPANQISIQLQAMTATAANSHRKD